MNESTDTPQAAYLRDLEAKRAAAFADMTHDEHVQAVYREWAAVHPQWAARIRSNQPHSPAPVAWYDRVDWPELLGTICGLLIVVAIIVACCIAFVRATQGWAR